MQKSWVHRVLGTSEPKLFNPKSPLLRFILTTQPSPLLRFKSLTSDAVRGGGGMAPNTPSEEAKMGLGPPTFLDLGSKYRLFVLYLTTNINFYSKCSKIFLKYSKMFGRCWPPTSSTISVPMSGWNSEPKYDVAKILPNFSLSAE